MDHFPSQRAGLTEHWLSEHGFILVNKQWRLAGFVLKKISLITYAVNFRSVFLQNVEYVDELERLYQQHIGSPLERL